jgi:hypothetical protein
MSSDGTTLTSTTIYAPGRKSFVTTRPDEKITSELTPDGRSIENTYNQDTQNLQRRSEIIPNTLNFGNNRTEILTTFDAYQNPQASTITIGSKISGQTSLNKEFNPNKNGDYREYTIIDMATKQPIETRIQDPQDKNSYITTNLKTSKTQKATLDNFGNLKQLTFTSKDGSKTEIVIKPGSQTTTVKDKYDQIISDVTINADGTAEVMSVVPETYTLSGGLIGTGRNKVTTSNIKDNRLNIDENGGRTTTLKARNKRKKEEKSSIETDASTQSTISLGTPPPVPSNAPTNVPTPPSYSPAPPGEGNRGQAINFDPNSQEVTV